MPFRTLHQEKEKKCFFQNRYQEKMKQMKRFVTEKENLFHWSKKKMLRHQEKKLPAQKVRPGNPRRDICHQGILARNIFQILLNQTKIRSYLQLPG